MGLFDYFGAAIRSTFAPVITRGGADGYAPIRSVLDERGLEAFGRLQGYVEKAAQVPGATGMHAAVVRDTLQGFAQYLSAGEQRSDILTGAVLSKSASSTGGMIGINDFGFKGKRQYIADRRWLLDLYVIALNNADIRTATTHLRNEIFRRGLDWEPAFEYKCDQCGKEYTAKEAKRLKGVCPKCKHWRDDDGNYLGEDGKPLQYVDEPGVGRHLSGKPGRQPLRAPSKDETADFDRFLEEANYFGQSLENVLRECEDDINVVDDAFIYFRKQYTLSDADEAKAKHIAMLMEMGVEPDVEEPSPEQEVMQVFRLDPVLVEFDLDYRGVPGMRHHVCVFHRDNLLEVPADEGWDVEWKGRCPECGMKTYPIYFKFNEQYLQGGYGTAQNKVLYLMRDEVIHWSRYTPTETYGYPPILSIYEKALTLIGMDRYLYDYFYERKVPQGVVTVVTDDVASFNATRAEVEARMQQDPHYIPWMAIASKSGQGKMEFVRFAYSLDELNYLPVRDEIRERVAGIYGVSSIWMSSSEGVGGLNSESQQLTVMSRVVEGAQRSYHTDVFPKLERALGVKDWHLRINTPEEVNEEQEIALATSEAMLASSMAQMGFGVEYDADEKVGHRFTFYGKVKSQDEQMQEQMKMANPFGGGGGPPQAGAQPGAKPFGSGGAGQGQKGEDLDLGDDDDGGPLPYAYG